MKAIRLTGRPEIDDAFEWAERDIPTPTEHDVLVKVEAISINPVDTKIRKAGSMQDIIGWDAVGIVEATGDGVTGFTRGDRVYYAGDIQRPGCYAEYQRVDARLVAKAPVNLEIEEIAALPLTTLTAWEGLFDRLPLTPHPPSSIDQDESDDDPSSKATSTPSIHNEPKTLLVINGAGGVGSMVTQLAKQLTSLKVITTASRSLSRLWSEELGADLVVNHYHLVEELNTAGIKEVDYIFCCHDIADHWENMVQLIRPFGNIVAIAETEKEVNINDLQQKAASFAWEFMFSRAIYNEHPEHQGAILSRVAQWMDSGDLVSTLSEVIGRFSVESVQEAHRRLEKGTVVGKLVLPMTPTHGTL